MDKNTLERISKEIIEKVSNIELYQDVVNRHFLLSAENEDELLKLYLLMGANPNVNESKAMLSFAKKGNIGAMKLLQKYGGNINIDMSELVAQNNIQVVRYIIQEGGEVKSSYLTLAISHNNYDMVELLLQRNIEIDSNIMKVALCTSRKIVELFLEHTDGKFPKNSFCYEENPWELIEELPIDVLEMVLEKLEEEPRAFGIEKNGIIIPHKIALDITLSNTLQEAIKEANYQRVKLMVEFFKRTGRSLEALLWHKNLLYQLGRNSESSEQLNEILRFLKQNGLLVRIRKYSKFGNKNYEIFSVETLELLNIKPDHKMLKTAIRMQNVLLVKELLDKEVLPTQADEDLAFQQITVVGKREEKEKIYKMVILARHN